MTAPRLVIVGSGPIGATYARIVLENNPDVEVVMVELGPSITSQPGLNVRNIADRDAQTHARLASQGPNSPGTLAAGGLPGGVPAVEGTFTARQGTHLVDDGSSRSGHAPSMPAAALATNVGGQGAHWTCACPAPVDDERVPFIPDAEWEELIGTAQRLLHVRTDAFQSPITTAITGRLQNLFGDRLPADRPVGPMPVAVEVLPDGRLVWTGTDTVFGPVLEPGSGTAARFELRARTQARRILLEDGKVRGVLLRDLATGREYEEDADRVVVAADAIRTPQLLFASGIRPKALGRYLTEHPIVLSTIALDSEVVESAYPDGVPEQTTFTTAAGDHVAAAIRVPFAADGFPYSVQVMHLTSSPIPLDAADPAARSQYGYLNVGFGSRKHPRAEDGLTFSESDTDMFDMPTTTIDYALTDAELADLERAKQEQARAIAALGTPIAGGEPRVAPAGASLHYMGTFRMGQSNDGTSVIDPASRVWDVDGLVLGGNGAIPTANVVNPTLFSTALAVRGARALAASLEREAITAAR